jgi:hypothetical protein
MWYVTLDKFRGPKILIGSTLASMGGLMIVGAEARLLLGCRVIVAKNIMAE